MKKVLCLVLAFMMIFTTGVTVIADDGDAELNDEHCLNLGDFETETSKIVVEEAGRVVNTITDKWVIDRLVGYIGSISGTQDDFDTNDEDVIRLTLYPNETSLIKDKIMVIEKVPGNYRTSIKVYSSDMELLDERYYAVYGLETYLRQAGIKPVHMDGAYKNITWNLTKEGILTLNGTGTTAKDRDSDAWVDAWVKELVIGEGITVADGFGNYENLEKITFPSTLETIEALSFTCCNKLEKVVIPENVSLIRIMAFDECENLKEVIVTSKVPLKIERSAFDIADGSVIHLPDTVYDIQEHAFTDTFPVMHGGDYGCFDEDCDITIDAPLGSYAYNWAVENDFKVTDSKSDTEVIDGVPFEDKSDLEEEAVVELKEYTLSREELFDQIETLADKNGFTVYRSGASLAVQNGASYFAISNDKVAYMENGLLAEENIYFDGVQVKYPEAALEAFFAIRLNGKTISDIIAEDTLLLEKAEDCVIVKGLKKNVESISIPEKIYGNKVKIAEGAFENCRNLKKVTVGEGIEEIPDDCFFGASNLEEVNLPGSLITIGACSFWSCDAFKEVDIKNVKVIEDCAFAWCSNLKSVKHNSLLEKIGYEGFYNCGMLSEIDLSGVKALGACAFQYCDSLTKVTLLSLESWEGVKDNDAEIETGKHRIGQPEAWHGGMVFYHGLAPMVQAPFKDCDNLTEVTVRYPENKEGEAFPSLFVNCPNIKSVTIENYQPCLARWEFSNLTYDNHDGYVFVGNAPKNLVIYSDDWAAEDYATLLGVKFSFIKTDIDEKSSAWDDNYILTVDDITGDNYTIIIDATVTARNKAARKVLMDSYTWDFDIEYELQNGWGKYGSLSYVDLDNLKTENSRSYRLNFEINYKNGESEYKSARLSSEALKLSGDKKYVVCERSGVVDEVEFPLSGQEFEGGKLTISPVSISATIGVEDATSDGIDELAANSYGIKLRFKDGTVKNCNELFGDSSRSLSYVWGTSEPSMYKIYAKANKRINLADVQSIIVNNVEYDFENPENYTYVETE